MITVIHGQQEAALPRARVQGDSLWLDSSDIQAATGWQWKPEGLCKEEACIPLPAGAGLVQDDRLNMAGLWQTLGHPVVHDQAGDTWVLGVGSAQRAQDLSSLTAPDVELPDLSGRMHRLSDQRGKRVLLVTWASW